MKRSYGEWKDAFPELELTDDEEESKVQSKTKSKAKTSMTKVAAKKAPKKISKTQKPIIKKGSKGGKKK